MKKLLLLIAPVVLMTGCDTTTMQPMPRDPYVGRNVERADGGHGTGVNHPDLDPSRYGRDGRAYDRSISRDYDYGYDGYSNNYGRGYNRGRRY
jgi:hypothetical protein